jgi:hypothetical protein
MRGYSPPTPPSPIKPLGEVTRFASAGLMLMAGLVGTSVAQLTPQRQ